MFVKKVLLLTTALFVFIGCDGSDFNYALGTCNDNYLEITAPSLELDSNGYYHMTFLDDYVQTFTTLQAETGSNNYEKLGWITDEQILFNDEWIYLVNRFAYTDEEGIGNTVLSIWEEHVNDTIMVVCGYSDNCNIHYYDSLYVVVN